jgi:phosphoadenosine phosphosulfate reductase
MVATHEALLSDQSLARRANEELASASPSETLAWALRTFGKAFCITTSLADAVLVDMASRIRPEIHVVFADTGYHFPETLKMRSELVARYPIRLVSARSTVEEHEAEHDRPLFLSDPDRCCHVRKVEPINMALRGYRAWASGIRRDETPTRANIGIVEWDATRSLVKVNPLANWTQSEVDAYIEANDVLVSPLRADGYVSIGCAPCTLPRKPDADVRSGRWVGLAKRECGLHTG